MLLRLGPVVKSEGQVPLPMVGTGTRPLGALQPKGQGAPCETPAQVRVLLCTSPGSRLWQSQKGSSH